jgi:hypothetical protein
MGAWIWPAATSWPPHWKATFCPDPFEGCDIVQKYQDIWVAQPKSMLRVDRRVRRVPIKTQSSAKFFVLHDFINRIGFIEWAVSRGNRFLFPEFMRLHNPSKSASQYMQLLFIKAGMPPRSGEVFH